MTLPATLFPPDVPADCKLQVVAFRSGSFFPIFGNSSRTRTHSRQFSVNTPVIYVGLGEDEDLIFSYHSNTNNKHSKSLFNEVVVPLDINAQFNRSLNFCSSPLLCQMGAACGTTQSQSGFHCATYLLVLLLWQPSGV